jgi:hypothetical protein
LLQLFSGNYVFVGINKIVYVPMKKILISIVLICLITDINAQSDEFQTIRSKSGITISGFGGPMMSFTQIGGDFAHMMGGGGGIIINDFFFGGYGMGKTNELVFKNDITLSNVMVFGHGGFWFGYTMFGNKAIHPVIHTQVGWGAISQFQKDWQTAVITPEPLSTDQVFVLAPTAELELNFSRFFRLGGGMSYSFVYNTDGPYTFADFAKPGFFISFKFGYFK